MSKTLLFQHIPKTAGSTIIGILESKYAENKRYQLDAMNIGASLQDFKNFSETQRNAFNLIYGHLSDRLIPYLNETPIVFTFLRDPIETFVSGFFYIKRATWNRFHQDVKQISSILEFADFWKEKNMINNQTRYIAGKTDYVLKDGHPDTPVDQEMFKLALEKLSSIDLVFTVERFDESILFLEKQMHWKSKPFYVKRNRTKGRKKIEDLTPEEIERLQEELKYDLLLYKEAQKRSDALLDNADLPLANFRLRNNIYQVKSKLSFK